jgi:Zn-dependent peptidase ImmA (M78 family)
MARTNDSIEQLAEDLRTALGLATVRAPDIGTLLERLREKYPRFKIEQRLERDLPNDEAYFDSVTMTLAIRESVLNAALEGNPRARMTVLHEIGHFTLGHQGTRSRSSGVDFRSANSGRVKAEEVEAYRFAAAFAAPMPLLKGVESAADIEQFFCMSWKAAQIRWEQLQTRRRMERGERRPLPRDVVDFLEEARRRGLPVRSLE